MNFIFEYLVIIFHFYAQNIIVEKIRLQYTHTIVAIVAFSKNFEHFSYSKSFLNRKFDFFSRTAYRDFSLLHKNYSESCLVSVND